MSGWWYIVTTGTSHNLFNIENIKMSVVVVVVVVVTFYYGLKGGPSWL